MQDLYETIDKLYQEYVKISSNHTDNIMSAYYLGKAAGCLAVMEEMTKKQLNQIIPK